MHITGERFNRGTAIGLKRVYAVASFFISLISRIFLLYPIVTQLIIALPTSLIGKTLLGEKSFIAFAMNLYKLFQFCCFSNGSITPGRKLYSALKPSLNKSFSVFPFTRAHIAFPFSLLSVYAPET